MSVNQPYGTREIQRDLIASIRQVHKQENPGDRFDERASIGVISLDSLSKMEVCGIIGGKMQAAGMYINPDSLSDWMTDSFASDDTTILSGSKFFAEGVSRKLKPLPQTPDAVNSQQD